MRACARTTSTAPTTPASRSAALRLEKAVAAAFLEAITPAGVRACAEAIGELERQHEERLAGQRLAVERAEFEAGRARRQFDACEPENRLVARTLERTLEEALAELERERRKLAELETRRPEPLTRRRASSARAAAATSRDYGPPTTTTARDRKELLRTLISEVDRHRQAATRAVPRSRSSGKAAPAPSCRCRSFARGPERNRTSEDTIELIRQLAAHTPTSRSPRSSTSKAAAPAPACRSTSHASSVLRVKHGIPAAPPPDPDSDLFTIEQAADELGVAHTTIYRWLQRRPAPGEQTTPHAPWRIRLTDEIRATVRARRARRLSAARSRPPSASGARARPFCTRSNAASCTPSRSPADGEKA